MAIKILVLVFERTFRILKENLEHLVECCLVQEIFRFKYSICPPSCIVFDMNKNFTHLCNGRHRKKNHFDFLNEAVYTPSTFAPINFLGSRHLSCQIKLYLARYCELIRVNDRLPVFIFYFS